MLIRPIRGASPFCGGLAKSTGKPCRRPAGHDTGHPGIGRCKLHGGATPTHQAAANIAMARDTAQLFAVPREVHPIEGMLEEYYRTAGMVDSYEAMCAGLLPAEVVEGVISVEETEGEPASDGGEESLSPGQRKVKRGASVNVWVKLYNEERERFAKLGEALLRLDLDSRKVELAQSHVAAIVAILLSPDLALSDDQRRAAARIMRGMDSRAAIEGSVA
jgi:hypothetical protein